MEKNNRPRNRNGQFTQVYEFNKLKLDDFIVIPIQEKENFNLKYNSIRSAAYNFSVKNNRKIKFKCKKTESGIRVKRVL